MVENNKLVARNKFISKLEKRITKMNQSLLLLSQVDEKLFVNQTGGSGLVKLGLNIAELSARVDAWETAMTASTDLNKKLTMLDASITLYQQKLKDIIDSLGMPPTTSTPLTDYFTINENAYNKATAVYMAIASSVKFDTTKFNTLIGEFNKEVDGDTHLDDANKVPIQKLFRDAILDQLNAAITKQGIKTDPVIDGFTWDATDHKLANKS